MCKRLSCITLNDVAYGLPRNTGFGRCYLVSTRHEILSNIDRNLTGTQLRLRKNRNKINPARVRIPSQFYCCHLSLNQQFSSFSTFTQLSLAINVEKIRENNCVRDLKEFPVLLVCQHLFKCQIKQQQKIIYANVYRNTINDGDSQTSLLPIFSEGGGASVHRLHKYNKFIFLFLIQCAFFYCFSQQSYRLYYRG